MVKSWHLFIFRSFSMDLAFSLVRLLYDVCLFAPLVFGRLVSHFWVHSRSHEQTEKKKKYQRCTEINVYLLVLFDWQNVAKWLNVSRLTNMKQQRSQPIHYMNEFIHIFCGLKEKSHVGMGQQWADNNNNRKNV